MHWKQRKNSRDVNYEFIQAQKKTLETYESISPQNKQTENDNTILHNWIIAGNLKSPAHQKQGDGKIVTHGCGIGNKNQLKGRFTLIAFHRELCELFSNVSGMRCCCRMFFQISFLK